MKSFQQRLGVSARMNLIMPRFQELIGRVALFGKFDPSDIKTILADEAWFSNGEPRWYMAPTAGKMAAKWRKAVERLSRKQFHSSYPDAPLAAAQIGACTPNNRCASSGCYLCSRAFQRWLIWAIRHLLKKDLSNYHDIAFTCVFPAGQAPLNGLAGVSFDFIAAQISDALERSKCIRHAVLAVDISLNVDTAKFAAGLFCNPPEIYWQVHFHGIARTTDPDQLFDSLRALYPKDEKIDKPVLLKKFNGSKYGISYLFKPEAYRRVHFKNASKWKIRGYSLKAREQVEFLTLAHNLGFSRQVVLVNLHPIRLPQKPSKKPRIGLRVTAPIRFAESYDGKKNSSTSS